MNGGAAPSGAAVALAVALAGAAVAPVGVADVPAGARGAVHHTATAQVPLRLLLGQRIMVGLPGTYPGPELLRRVREGQVGGVILFGYNIAGVSRTRALTRALQRAALAGRNPPLLIAVDQEGGRVRRFATAPPRRTPAQLVATGRPAAAYQEGLRTGRYLRRAGVNMDLAPVVDVPTRTRSFIRVEGRAFSRRARLVARYATAFARGLQAAGVAATAKHFPGVGSATIDTDFRLDELRPTRSELAAALLPYRRAIAAGIDAVMLCTAGFPDYDATGTPSALSRPIATGLLRGQLGFGGVAITDALGTPTGHGQVDAGVLAAGAGADVLLYTDAARGVLGGLIAAALAGRLDAAGLQASYERVVALKRHVAA